MVNALSVRGPSLVLLAGLTVAPAWAEAADAPVAAEPTSADAEPAEAADAPDAAKPTSADADAPPEGDEPAPADAEPEGDQPATAPTGDEAALDASVDLERDADDDADADARAEPTEPLEPIRPPRVSGVFLGGAIWGGAFIFIAIALDDFGPISIASWSVHTFIDTTRWAAAWATKGSPSAKPVTMPCSQRIRR